MSSHHQQPVCRFWQSAGGCRFGSQCRFRHGAPSAPSATNNTVERDIACEARAHSFHTSVAWDVGPLSTTQDELALHRYLVISEHESGRGIDLPQERIEVITTQAALRNITVVGAFSLRRQFLRQMAIRSGKSFYGDMEMGDATSANLHAERFELLVQNYLLRHNPPLPHLREGDLYARGSRNTPDFLLLGRILINGVPIRWIDCKTYFGSSLLASDDRLPIGKLLKQADRYNKAFCGDATETGAFVFLCGVSSQLLEQLAIIAGPHRTLPLPLLLNSHPIDTSHIFAEQAEAAAAYAAAR